VASVTVTGTNFGTIQGNSTAYLYGDSTAATTTSWSNTSIAFTIPTNAVSGVSHVYTNVVYSGGTLTSNYFPFIVGSPPTITSISPSSGPAGMSVTISGTNFNIGNGLGALSVTFNGTKATVLSSTATSIVAAVPAAATTGSVVVDVDGYGATSNGVNFTVVPGPGITLLYPTLGGFGTSVEILGANFGAVQGTSTVTFNGVVVPSGSLTWYNTEIFAPVPAGSTTGNVVVTVGGVASNGISFAVTSAPTIQSIDPSTGYVGESVDIYGYSFGATQGSSAVTFNGTPANPSAWTQADITVPVPIGATTGTVVVTVNSTASNGYTFTVGPQISGFSPGLGQVGASVTVNGIGFGGTRGTSTITFNGTTATPTTWVDNQIAVPVPSGATTGYVRVTVGGVASNSVLFTVGSTPGITSISPTSGPVGSTVTINGSNLYGVGSNYSATSVTFNGTLTQALSGTPTMLIVPVPAGATTGNVVDTLGGVASNGVNFTVVPGPGLGSISPASAAVGAFVTVNGGNFGNSQGGSTITFNGVTATPTSWSSNYMYVQVPTGTTTGNVVVTVGGVASNPLPFTVVPAATITSLSSSSGSYLSSLTITGTNFGTTQGRVNWGTSTFSIANWGNTSIVVTLPQIDQTQTAPITVVASGTYAPGNAMLFTVLNGYIAVSVSPTNGTVGTSVTISAQGRAFGDTQSSSTVTFSGAPAVPASWSATSITVPVPPAASTGEQVTVTVNNVPSFGGLFAVVPVISSVSPSSGPIDTPVTITGTGFGPSEANNSPLCDYIGWGKVTFNGAVAHPTSWTPSAIIVPVPNYGTTGPGPVVVSTCGWYQYPSTQYIPSNGVTFTIAPVTSGTISGAVTNILTSAPVSGVAVAALQSGVTIASTTTLVNGSYSIPNLAPGTYDVQVTGSGYVTALRTGNTVSTVTTTTLNLALSTAPIITSISPTWGGAGTSTTILGSNFGLNQLDSTGSVTFNGAIATPSSWNTNSIVVPVPSGATTGSVVVSVGGVASNGATFTVGAGSLTGVITSGANGQSVSGALVQALLAHIVKGTATSSSTGSYTISNLGPGGYDIVASVSGLGSAITTGQTVVVGTATTVNMVLPAAGSDSGSVTNGTTGISGAIVSALQSGDVVSTATTNASGNFSMSNLAAGTYAIQASAQGYALQTTSSVSVTAGNNTVTNFTLSGQSTLSYDYDALGRLVGVVDSLNGSAVYNYDAVGNVTSIQKLTAAQVGIISFAPTNGLVGAIVTIYGTNFSGTPSQNNVTFNGTAATVSTASTTQLVVNVPVGATSGPVSVTTPAGSASSTGSFLVLASGSATAPTITSITPPVAGIGDSVTISGNNFDPTPANDNLILNGMTLAINSATSTTMTLTVPSGVTTGHIYLATSGGSTTSTSYLFIAPSPYTASQVGYTGQIMTLPGSLPPSIAAGQIGILGFDGTSGQSITLQTSASSLTNGCQVPGSLRNPAGTSLYSSNCFGPSGTLLGATQLSQTGTYVILIGPAGGPGSETITVANELPALTGFLWLNGTVGTTVPINIQEWGQNALFTFNGTAQQTATVHVTQNGIPGLSVFVYGPDGTQLATIQSGSTSFNLSAGTLPFTGSYLVKVVPNLGTQYYGNLSLSVTSP
jgi:YD repeat-containing protein